MGTSGLQSTWGQGGDRGRAVWWREQSTTMAQLTPLIAATSVGGWVELLILLGLLFLDYWATLRIITQAGYSSMWILLPLAPLVFTIICYVILWNDLHAIFFGSSFGFAGTNASLFWNLDKFSILLNWIFYLIFAFSRWPVNGSPRTSSAAAPLPAPPSRAVPGPAASSPATPAPLSTARVLPSSAAGPGAPPAGAASSPATKRPGAQFCPWCAEPLPGNRALFHDCGPKERPETYCKNCGKALPAGSSECASCAAA